MQSCEDKYLSRRYTLSLILNRIIVPELYDQTHTNELNVSNYGHGRKTGSWMLWIPNFTKIACDSLSSKPNLLNLRVLYIKLLICLELFQAWLGQKHLPLQILARKLRTTCMESSSICLAKSAKGVTMPRVWAREIHDFLHFSAILRLDECTPLALKECFMVHKISPIQQGVLLCHVKHIISWVVKIFSHPIEL